MIEASGLSRRFGRVRAVRDIGLSAGPGRVLGLVGANGAGKSTTLRLLAGLLAPDTGEVRVQGIDALREPRRARGLIGYLPESGVVHPEMTPREYLSFRASLYAGSVGGRAVGGRSGRRAAVEKAIELLELGSVADRPIATLSKGFTQRTALAGALVHDPPVLILDEPTNGLDVAQLRQARTTLRRLGEGRTMIVSSHLIGEIERLCDEITVIASGVVVANGTAAELSAKAGPTRIVAEYRLSVESGTDPIVGLSVLSGVETSRVDGGWVRVESGCEGEPVEAMRAIGRAAAGAGIELRRLEEVRTSLDDALTGLIRGGTDVVEAGS